jgi:predicted metal-dependent enzyme (double-stranded beta helix superfamily)
MFDIERFVEACRLVVGGSNPAGHVREILERELEHSDGIAAALGGRQAGLDVLYNGVDLTVLNVIWAPHMTLYPHDHRMWATIGIYGGAEENTLYRRGPERLQAAGSRSLDARDVLSLGKDAIHSVHNPRDRYTGAIHVYGGDFVNKPRSQWDPDTLLEEPYDLDQVRRLFAAANDEWRSQLGQDLDESAQD